MKSITVCPECNKNVKTRDLGFYTVYYCMHCADFLTFILNDECCKDVKIIMVKTYMVDGRLIMYNQCQNCGYRTQGAVSYKHINGLNIESIPNVNFQAREDRKRKLREEINEFTKLFLRHKEKIVTLKIVNENDPYYLSSEWKIRRKLVFERDNNICQSCFTRSATQVHHLTYSHFKNEPLFDLVAICYPCHLIVSKIDKKVKGVQQITYTNINHDNKPETTGQNQSNY